MSHHIQERTTIVKRHEAIIASSVSVGVPFLLWTASNRSRFLPFFNHSRDKCISAYETLTLTTKRRTPRSVVQRWYLKKEYKNWRLCALETCFRSKVEVTNARESDPAVFSFNSLWRFSCESNRKLYKCSNAANVTMPLCGERSPEQKLDSREFAFARCADASAH